MLGEHLAKKRRKCAQQRRILTNVVLVTGCFGRTSHNKATIDNVLLYENNILIFFTPPSPSTPGSGLHGGGGGGGARTLPQPLTPDPTRTGKHSPVRVPQCHFYPLEGAAVLGFAFRSPALSRDLEDGVCILVVPPFADNAM